MELEFVMIAEAGVLEQQALLLCESIRAFGGRYAEAAITVLHPRAERSLSEAGRVRFAGLGARVVPLAIVSPCPEYGTSYRIFACAEYERLCAAERLIFLDSDMVMLAEPDLELDGADVAARPVDINGMCTAGADDPKDSYWRALCRVCEVDYDALPEVITTVDRVKVKASYNGGLTVVSPRAGLFQKTADFFMRSLAAQLLPWPDQQQSFPAGHGMVSAAGGRHWGSAQACLSLAITALGLRVRVLPASQNFPLHSYPDLRSEIEVGALPTVALVHYHQVFRDHPYDNPLVAGEPGFPPGAGDWLKARIGPSWKTGRERLIVVLGMHRSGTSALTKGLEALGADLGANFHPATPDNPKGFWEDRLFHGLNEELMAALQHSWDAFALLDDERISRLCEGAFFTRALALVRRCFARSPLAGVKDPRFSVLLPFWKKVFAEVGIPVSYILAFRNPLSVVQSLAKRDEFPAARSLWLWIVYNAQAIAHTADASPLVVGYDELMDDPVGQLARMARLLDLPLDESVAKAFATEFLEPALRHAQFTDLDVHEGAICDPLVRTIYETLRSQARAGALVKRDDWQSMISACELTFAQSRNLLKLASDASLENQTLRRQLAESQHQLESRPALPAESEAWIAEMDAAFKTEIAAQTAQLAAKNVQLAAKDVQLGAAGDALATLNAEIATRAAQIQQLEAATLELGARAKALEADLARLKDSRSWRITAPLRALWKRLHPSR